MSSAIWIKRHQNDNSKFKRGSGVYECLDCGKKTRDTGNGEGGTGLCKKCFNAAEEYNAIQDGLIIPANNSLDASTNGAARMAETGGHTAT